MARKKGFIIKVQEMYKWKNVPILKVLFYDCQRFAYQLRSDATVARVMSSFFKVTWLHMVERIVADQQVVIYNFLVKLLTAFKFLKKNNYLSSGHCMSAFCRSFYGYKCIALTRFL